MNNFVRINSTFSPYIEYNLKTFNITKDVIDFFTDLKKNYTNLRHVSSFSIPYELKPIIDSHPKLKAIMCFLDTDTQSNIIYTRNKFNHTKCGPLHHLFKDSPEVEHSLRFILGKICKNRIPFVADNESKNLEKLLCEHCDESKECKSKYNIPVANVKNSAEFISEVNKCIDFNFKTMSLVRKSLSIKDIKAAISLSAFFNNTSIKDYKKFFGSIKIHPDLCNDIAKSSTPLLNIFFSIYRSYAFPSASDPSQKRHTFSIDWHKNNPENIATKWGSSAKMDLYRVDVLPSDRSGIKSSGPKRLLMGFKDNNVYYIAYTDTHDFICKTIRRRVEKDVFE